ncbi:MAG TPA: SpaA isopeptide-forming pilin-related protein, partial [Gemmatimonadales bacterium]|nr:SpaA isopeptide-forming pilin-related protein [Gemmatimonadales bacterium]
GVADGANTLKYTSNTLSVSAGTPTLVESAVAGYTAGTWSCTGVAGAVNGTFNDGWVVVANGEAANCTITNDDIPGTLSWEKRLENGDSPSPLQGGATFEVSPNPTGGGTPLTVEDCGTAPCTGADQDETPGQLKLINVPWGTYTVTETITPLGFALDDDATRAVTVDESSLDAVVGVQDQDDEGNGDESDFHNRMGTLIINKVSSGGDGAFGYTMTGTTVTGIAVTDATPFDGDEGVITTTSGTGSRTRSFVLAGSYTFTEAATAGFVLTNLVCTASSGSSATPSIPTATPNASITLAAGGTVTCTYTNTQATPATRTLGFWATHLSYASSEWLTIPSASRQACTAARTVGVAELEGAFWSDIAKTSVGVRRSALDQARMQLIQQLTAAMLNATFGISSSDQANIAGAAAAYCSPTATRAALLSWASILDAFNKSGDTVPLPGNPGPANSKDAQGVANKPFWDGPLP